MSCGLPAQRLCVVHPQSSSRSSLNHGDGERVMEWGWWRRDDVCPSCPYNLPRFTLFVTSNTGNALGSTCLPKTSQSKWQLYGKTHIIMQLISETPNTGAGMSGKQPALSTGISSRQVQEGCRTPAGRRGGWGDASSNNTQCSPDWIKMNFTVRKKPGLKCVI